MPTPIKSSNTNGSPVNGAGMSPALNELMNKLNAQTNQAMGGAGAESPQQAFSRWMEKHALGADAARRQESPAPASSASQSNAVQNNVAASRAAEQALVRARQLSASAARPLEQKADPAPVHNEPRPVKARHEQPNSAKSNRKEGADKPAQADRPAEGDAQQQGDEVRFNTAEGEGAAVVRELTPPPDIQSGDPASMMAWLASLTSGDLQTQSLAEGEMAEGEQGAVGKDGGDAATLDLSSRGKGAGRGLPGGMTLDLQSWQGVQGKADALMDTLGKGVRMEGDPLAGLMPGGPAKASGFGQILGDAAQGLRHESATLHTPFGSPEFPQALAQKVSMWVGMARDGGPMTAELHLNPAEMGPINVKIALDGQSAHVDFAAAALETRQAIEASLSMLSSALNDVGLSLTGGGVSSQTSQQAFDQAAAREGQLAGTPGGAGGQGDQPDDGDGLSTRQVAAPRPGRAGGLDLYA